MALTTQQQTDLYKLGVGMFGASLGTTYMNQLANLVNAGVSVPQLYDILANSPAFQGLSFGFTNAATNQQFATAFVDQLLGSSVSAANRTWAIDWVTGQLNAGVSRGQVMKTAIDALDAVASTDANFGNAAARFDNRVTVARNYTEVQNGSATSVSTLQNTIATVDQTQASVDAAINANAGASGQTFALTTGADNITGTSSNDTITAYIDTDNSGTSDTSTLTAADVINGGAGTDTLAITVDGDADSNTGLPAAAISNVENVSVRNVSTGTLAYNFATVSGESQYINNTSTGNVEISNFAGSTVTVRGDGSTTVGTTKIGMSSGTAALTLNIDGGVKGGSNITRDNTGAATIVVNSTGAANVVGTVDLDTAALLTGLTINATTDLTANLAADYAANSTLTVTGAGVVDLTGAALAANFKSVDASAQTAGGTRVVLGANTTSFTGGAGNDVIAVDALVFNSTGKIDGGTGTGDVLRVTDAAALTSATAANVSNVEILRIADDNDNGADAFDASLISGLTGVQIDAMAGGDSVTLNKVSSTLAGAITIRGSQADGPTINVTGAADVGQLDTLSVAINDGATAKNTITVANITAAGVETVNLALTDNLTLQAATGLTAVTALNVTGSGNANITTGALALNVNTTVDASALTGTFQFTAAAATTNGLAIKGSSTKANTITATGQADSITGGSADDTITAGNGIDTINISQGGDDTIVLDGIVAAANRDVVTGFTAGTYTAGSGVDRLEMNDAQVTTAFGAASGTMQTVSSAPTSALTFNTAANNVLELSFDLAGNGSANDLDSHTDGTGLLAALGQTVSVSADTNAGYIVAYQDGKAYLFRAAEGADANDTALAAGDITLVGVFNSVAVGAFTASNFIDAV